MFWWGNVNFGGVTVIEGWMTMINNHLVRVGVSSVPRGELLEV